MSKRMKQTILILAAVLIVFSIVVFAIPFHKGGTFWIAYLAEVLAIALQFPIFQLAYAKGETLNSKVLGFPVFRVGYLYLGLQTAASVILFILGGIFTKLPVWIAAVVCVVILGFALVGSIAMDIARDEVEKVEQTTGIQTALMKQLRGESAVLPSLTEDPALKKQLEQLAEQFQYSDPVSSPALEPSEAILADRLAQLRGAVERGDASAAQQIKELSRKLEERNLLCRKNK